MQAVDPATGLLALMVLEKILLQVLFVAFAHQKTTVLTEYCVGLACLKEAVEASVHIHHPAV